jgi:hypothetical protein
MTTAARAPSPRGLILPPTDVGYFVVLLGPDILLDDNTCIGLADCDTRRPIATFSCYVAAQRAARRVSHSGAIPFFVQPETRPAV